MRSANQHVFAEVPSIKIPRSVFDTSATYKTAFNSGKLIPFVCREVLPGDTFNLVVKAFARLTTPIVPFMDNVFMDFQFFFVPSRLVWENWQKFCGEQDNPGDSIDYLVPTITAPEGGFAVGSNYDYLGIPTGVAGIKVNALPLRALHLIWNNWYRPETLANSKVVDVDDGPDTASDYSDLLPRYNRLDYLQGCLPSPQRGAGVGIGLGGTAPVIWDLQNIPSKLYTGTTSHSSGAFSAYGDGTRAYLTNNASGVTKPGFTDTSDHVQVLSSSDWLSTAMSADLSQASAITINSLREAFQVQLFKEREQLAGSRYREIILGMFGVRTPDYRVQIPEYLGGGTLPVQVHSVAQTSQTASSGTPQGNLAAYGVAGGSPVGFVKSFTEYGYVIGFVSVRADITYQQGLDRMWSRQTRFDFYWPVFAHLGEQAVLNKEIYAQGTDDDDGVFGYQERYAELRYGSSHVTGKLRSTASDSLDVWHLAPYYLQLPVLGDEFAQVNVPFDRVLAVTDQPQFVFDSLIKCRSVRPMPLYGQPGRIDHYF